MARARALALTLAGVMVVALVVAVARDGDGEASVASTAPDPAGELCAGLERFGAAIAHLDALEFIDSVADEHVPYIGLVQARWREVQHAAREVPGADPRRLGVATHDLAAMAPRLDPGTPAARSRAALEPQIVALFAAWGQMHQRVGCPPAGPPS
jgi:hypothetical protein